MAGSLLQNAPALLHQLPELIAVSDAAFYVFGVLFFGSLAMRGFRGSLHPVPHFGVRVLMGLISIMSGMALAGFFPFLQSGIYQILRADMLAGALVSSIVLAGGLYLATFRLINVRSLEKKIEKMKKRLEQGKHTRTEKRGWKDPAKLAGVAVILAVLGFSLLNFHGFPSMGDSLSSLGISPGDLQRMGSSFGGPVPEGCVNTLSLLQGAGGDITTLPQATDDGVRNLIEQGAGAAVIDLRLARSGGTDYYLGFTQNKKFCAASATLFCDCVDTTQFQ